VKNKEKREQLGDWNIHELTAWSEQYGHCGVSSVDTVEYGARSNSIRININYPCIYQVGYQLSYKLKYLYY